MVDNSAAQISRASKKEALEKSFTNLKLMARFVLLIATSNEGEIR
jgi:hypothetical protein